jgi:hypothetical protein
VRNQSLLFQFFFFFYKVKSALISDGCWLGRQSCRKSLERMRSSTPRLHPTSRRCRNVVAGGENRTQCSMVKSWINGYKWPILRDGCQSINREIKGQFQIIKEGLNEKDEWLYVYIYTVYILYIYIYVFICHIYIPYIYIHIPKISGFPWWDGWPSPTIFWPWHRCGVWQKDHSKRTRQCPARSMELCNIMYIYIIYYYI